jgi:ADP-ribose pyrophosphatase YjhB (NUDIX family)
MRLISVGDELGAVTDFLLGIQSSLERRPTKSAAGHRKRIAKPALRPELSFSTHNPLPRRAGEVETSVPTPKVMLYIVAEGRLLMFRRPLLADQGLQVPGGTVEPGESLEQAALREAVEETGLTDLRLEAFLGTAEYVTRDPPGVVHLRHFFHLSRPRAEPASWRHAEAHGAHFQLFWEPIETALPDWEMDVYLAALRG